MSIFTAEADLSDDSDTSDDNLNEEEDNKEL